MKLAKIAFLMFILNMFALQAMIPQSYQLLPVADNPPRDQAHQQPSEIQNVWFSLVKEYMDDGTINQQLVDRFNQLREEGARFNYPYWTGYSNSLRQELGITMDEWRALQPQ